MKKNTRTTNNKNETPPTAERDLTNQIIDFLATTDSKTSSIRKIINRFNRNVEAVMSSLEKLETQNQIIIKSNQQVKLVSKSKVSMNHVEGVIDFNQSGNAYLIVPGVEKDIFIHGKNTGTALQGDTVKVELAQRVSNKIEGRVLEVVERKRVEFFAILHINKKVCFAIPTDTKVQTDFHVVNAKDFPIEDGMKVLIKMTSWNKNDRKPNAEIMQIVTEENSTNLMMESILIDNGFQLEFSSAVLEQTQAISTEITADEIAKRRDMRDILTFTIDPADAKDFDDAISIQYLEDGQVEVGVHIADVSHYIPIDSPLEKEAAQRATSVYLVDRVLPMLPEELSNGLCSLRPNEDKLTFSAVFIFDKNYKIIKEWFGRTVTHSNKRFTYEEAQEVIEKKLAIYEVELECLNKIAHHLREQKFKKGAIAFETQEVRFQLDEKNNPVDVYIKERKDAHLLIEDFMLLANRSVATELAKKYKFGVYRNHDLPDESKLADLALLARKFGYKMNLDTPLHIAESLNNLTEQSKGKPEEPMLQNLALRSMAKAYYSTVNIGHYGLAFPFYSHFTSPIRRYPDVLTHRLLQNYLDQQKSENVEALEKQCKHASVMERSAMEAERSSQKYFEALFMKSKVGEEFDGIISGLVSRGIYIQTLPYYCEGYIRISDIDPFLTFQYDESSKQVVSSNGNIIYKLGQKVRVLVKKVDVNKAQIDLEFVQ